MLEALVACPQLERLRLAQETADTGRMLPTAVSRPSLRALSIPSDACARILLKHGIGPTCDIVVPPLIVCSCSLSSSVGSCNLTELSTVVTGAETVKLLASTSLATSLRSLELLVKPVAPLSRQDTEALLQHIERFRLLTSLQLRFPKIERGQGALKLGMPKLESLVLYGFPLCLRGEREGAADSPRESAPYQL